MNCPDLHKRRGRVIFHQGDLLDDPKLLNALMGELFPLQVVPCESTFNHYFLAVSPHFDVIEKGGYLPLYIAEFTHQEDLPLTVKFEPAPKTYDPQTGARE